MKYPEHKCDKKPKNAIIFKIDCFWDIDAGYEDGLEDVIYCPWCGKKLDIDWDEKAMQDDILNNVFCGG